MRDKPRWRTRHGIGLLTALVVAGGLLAGGGTAAAGGWHSQDVYVSPFGSDQSPGTLLRPVRTPQRARDLVRARDQSLTGDLTVYVEPGVYRLSAPLRLDA